MLRSLSDQPGRQIGAYRLIEPLGEGGFGVVWRAEQTGPLRRALYGAPHPELGRSYESLAQCARAGGERDEACEFAVRAAAELAGEFERTHSEPFSIRSYSRRSLVEAQARWKALGSTKR